LPRNRNGSPKLLFTTDIGLMSLFTIVFIVGMGVW